MFSIFTVCRGHYYYVYRSPHSITTATTYQDHHNIAYTLGSIQAITPAIPRRSCAAPAVYASPHRKSLSSKGSANLIDFYHLASISSGVRANNMPEASLSVRSTNIYCFIFNCDGHKRLGLMCAF